MMVTGKQGRGVRGLEELLVARELSCWEEPAFGPAAGRACQEAPSSVNSCIGVQEEAGFQERREQKTASC